MLKYGPTGALSEYQYKGGVFHGVHYGDFHNDSGALFELIDKEEEFLLKSPERRRILFDLYNTDLTPDVLEYLMRHISHISARVFKLAFAADRSSLRRIKHALKKAKPIPEGCCMLNPDQDTCKTWLVSDGFEH